jgi:magnesium transporter
MKLFDRKYHAPGSAPGVPFPQGWQETPATVRVLAYSPEGFHEVEGEEAEAAFPYLDKEKVTWIDIVTLGDEDLMRTLGEHCGLHPLAMEDVVHVGQRPKLEDYGENLFVVMKHFHRTPKLEPEQISIFLGRGFVITFQERPGDVFDPVRERIRKGNGRIRRSGADYLAYALMDALVDQMFPILEDFGEQIELLEEKLIEDPQPADLEAIHGLKRDLLLLRRAAWPQREVLNGFERHAGTLVAKGTLVFLRDCYDHTIQILDLLETYRDLASGLMELYLSRASHRMNEIMKVLTVMASIFIPLTFVAGIYGMNFNSAASPLNMPELDWYWGYPAFWGLMVVVAGGLLLFFRRKGWF